MGTILAGESDTKLEVLVTRTCFQAGSSLKGKIVVTIGNDFKTLIEEYPAGLVVEAELFGSEKVYWANQHSHGPSI